MRAQRFNSLRQLAAVMAGFAVTILLIESEALTVWADRLEVSRTAMIAMQATSAIHRTLRPLGIEDVREEGVAGLDRLGWSDDPARLLAARDAYAAGAWPGRSCEATIATARTAITAPPRGASAPVVAGVPMRTTLPQLAQPMAGKPRTLALVGDSMMAVGLSDILLRQTAADQDVRVVKAFRSGTGLARPDVFDWMAEYPAMIGDAQPDAIIVAIGANDGQGFVDNGKVLAFGTDAWVKIYQQRTAAFLNMLTQNGAHVVWVALPPMKSGAYNEKIAEINRITYTVVSQYPQVIWWNPAPYLGGDKGAYREFATTPDGKTTRIRQADGIHMSDEGAALLAPALLNWLNPAPAVHVAQLALVPANPANHAKREGRSRVIRR
jgi:hypothetical protein